MNENPNQNPSKFNPGVALRKTKKISAYLFAALLLIAAVAYIICGITYSDGTRSGILLKVSTKGFVFKTFEGEISVGGMTNGEGTMNAQNTSFIFSVKKSDADVFDKLQMHQGKKVVLKYREPIKSFPWQGETGYFVYDVEEVTK